MPLHMCSVTHYTHALPHINDKHPPALTTANSLHPITNFWAHTPSRLLITFQYTYSLEHSTANTIAITSLDNRMLAFFSQSAFSTHQPIELLLCTCPELSVCCLLLCWTRQVACRAGLTLAAQKTPSSHSASGCTNRFSATVPSLCLAVCMKERRRAHLEREGERRQWGIERWDKNKNEIEDRGNEREETRLLSSLWSAGFGMVVFLWKQIGNSNMFELTTTQGASQQKGTAHTFRDRFAYCQKAIAQLIKELIAFCVLERGVECLAGGTCRNRMKH